MTGGVFPPNFNPAAMMN